MTQLIFSKFRLENIWSDSLSTKIYIRILNQYLFSLNLHISRFPGFDFPSFQFAVSPVFLVSDFPGFRFSLFPFFPGFPSFRFSRSIRFNHRKFTSKSGENATVFRDILRANADKQSLVKTGYDTYTGKQE